MRLSFTAPVLFMLLCAPLLMGAASRCDELLEKAGAELRREQYPTMLTLAQERQLLCPGADSSFLAGVAHANMLDHQLVPDSERLFVLEQALSELRGAVSGLRPEWQQTALSWITYLEALPADFVSPSGPSMTEGEKAETPPPTATPNFQTARRAAPPWEPDVFPWGPVLLGSGGALMLTAGLVTYLSASHLDGERERANRACMSPCRYTPPSLLQLERDEDTAKTLYVATDVLVVAGGASLAGAIVWYALRHTPSDPSREVTVVPWLGRSVVGAQAVGNF
jgi:hypothetical protein